jgi:hypothetical protein
VIMFPTLAHLTVESVVLANILIQETARNISFGLNVECEALD